MSLTIKHASLTGAAANPDVLVDGPKWDASHTITGSVAASEVTGLAASATIDTTVANNITTGTLPAARLPTPTASTLGGIKSPTSSVIGNIAYYNSTTGDALAASPAFHAGNPANAALYSQIASNGGLSGVYNGVQISIGTALTASEQFGAGGARLDQGIVGTGNISTSTGTATGVTGFAKSTAGSGANAIGVFGWGYACHATSSSVWALAGSVHNKSTLLDFGNDANSMIGLELDLNIKKKSGSVEPTISQLHGLLITGDGESTVNQGEAVYIAPLITTTGAKWSKGFYSAPGAAVNALVAGPTASSGTTLSSQPIIMQGVSGAGATITYSLFGDALKNLIVQHPTGGTTIIEDAAAAKAVTMGTSVGGAGIQLNSLAANGVLINDNTGVVVSASQLGLARGGVAADLSGTGGTGQYLKQAGVGAAVTVGTIPASDLICSATNDSAAAGKLSEYVEGILVSGSAVSLTSGAATNIISISLAAGDWDVGAIANFAPAATTSITQLMASLSTTTGTIDTTVGRRVSFFFPAFAPGGSFQSTPIPNYRFSLSGTTTIYLVVQPVFTVSTMTGYGIIRARRVR